jgi:hypothetical protein
MSPLMSRDIVPVTGFCEYGDYPSDSVEDGEFLDHLNDYYLLKKMIYYVQTALRLASRLRTRRNVTRCSGTVLTAVLWEGGKKCVALRVKCSYSRYTHGMNLFSVIGLGQIHCAFCLEWPGM